MSSPSAAVLSPPASSSVDERRVALIKSLDTDNRFYVLLAPDSGIGNADVIDQIPDDWLLGITYHCLEDALNDFAVIRTTFETLECFPDDPELGAELFEIINDTRGKLLRRLMELIDRTRASKLHFLGADLEEFKRNCLDLTRRGCPRRNIDSIMKVNVFQSVATAEGHDGSDDLEYRYEFRYRPQLQELEARPGVDWIVGLLSDVMDEAIDDDNYQSKFDFDRNVFQKFISLMFVSYATSRTEFLGTHREDYGISGEKDMEHSPLYRAVGAELRRLHAEEEARLARLAEFASVDWSELEQEYLGAKPPAAWPDGDGRLLLDPIDSIRQVARQLSNLSDPEAVRAAQLILSDTARLLAGLRELHVLPEKAGD